MEYLNTITQVVSTVGFPIMVALICFYYINKMTESHKTEIDSLKESLDSNTLVLAEIKAFMQMLSGKEE